MNPTTRTSLARQHGADLAPAESVTAELMPRADKILGAEIDIQVSTAKRYPRQIAKVIADAKELATASPEIAASCPYSLPRAGKAITGASIRLAEIIACTWGNLRCKAEIVDITDGSVVARGTVWDLERNVAYQAEVRRRIVDKQGRRFSDDMVIVTANAAQSLALRNAILRAVPRAVVDDVYHAALVRCGGMGPVAAIKLGISEERIWARLGISSTEEITDDHNAWLLGICSSIRDGDASADEEFPPAVKAAPEPVVVPDPQEGPNEPRGGTPAPSPSPAPSPVPPARPETPLGDDGPQEKARLEKLAASVGMAAQVLAGLRGGLSMGAKPQSWTASQCEELERRIEEYAGGAK